MPQPPDHDALTLAGLAAANGQWLATRLQRLAELSGLSVPPDVAWLAVGASSRVLSEILLAEGHPSLGADDSSDPVARMGREQAVAHQQAGLPMPASLKVQRLLHRAYDDLVRESWVDQDSRSRAHEDVERFFERALVGLVAAWTGHASRREAELRELADRRGERLRRALDVAKRCALTLRDERGRRRDLAGSLSVAAAELRVLRARPAEPAPPAAEAVVTETDESLRAELRALREAHASLASEAEAMRARLAEAGSRVSELRRARERDVERELGATREELAGAREKCSALEADLASESRRAREAGIAAAQRMAALENRATAERERLSMECERRETERGGLTAEVGRLEAERDGFAAELQRLERERDALVAAGNRLMVERAARIQSQIEAQTKIAGCVEELSRTQVELLNTRAALESPGVSGGVNVKGAESSEED